MRLNELPFLAATLAMGLALSLPWALSSPGDGEEAAVEASTWAAPDPADPSVQLAGESAAEGTVAQ